MTLHPINPSRPSDARAARAFRHVTVMEREIHRLRGSLRLFLMIDFDQVFNDSDDGLAILELIFSAQDMLAKIADNRVAAAEELHPFAYPAAGEEDVA